MHKFMVALRSRPLIRVLLAASGIFSAFSAQATLIEYILENDVRLLAPGEINIAANERFSYLGPSGNDYILEVGDGVTINNAGQIGIQSNWSVFYNQGSAYNALAGSLTANNAEVISQGNFNIAAGAEVLGGGSYTWSNSTVTIDGLVYQRGFTLGDGGVLCGSGTLNGDMVIQSNATLCPGNSPGTLTFNGNLTIEDGATIELEVGKDTSGNLVQDQIVVNGGLLSLDNVNVVLSFIDGASEDMLGDLNINDFFSLDNGQSADFSTTTFSLLSGGSTTAPLQINQSGAFSAVPEPGMLWLMGVSMMLTLRRKRR